MAMIEQNVVYCFLKPGGGSFYGVMVKIRVKKIDSSFVFVLVVLVRNKKKVLSFFSTVQEFSVFLFLFFIPFSAAPPLPPAPPTIRGAMDPMIFLLLVNKYIYFYNLL